MARFTDSAAYFWTSFILQSISSIICLSLLFSHLWKVYKHPKQDEPQDTIRKIITVLNILMMVFFTCAVTLIAGSTILYLADNDLDYVCHTIMVKLHCGLYAFAKSIMYPLFIFRYNSVYKESVFAMKETSFKVLTSIVITLGIAYTTAGSVGIGSYEYIIQNMNLPFCHAGAPVYFLIPAVLVDIGITLPSLCLFIKPLREMIKELRSTRSSCSTVRDFHYSIMKVSVLTIFAVSSTVFSMMFLAITFSNTFIWIDCAVNCVCMAAMTPYHRELYPKMCCCFIQWAKKQHQKRQKQCVMQHAKQMEMQHLDSSSPTPAVTTQDSV